MPLGATICLPQTSIVYESSPKKKVFSELFGVFLPPHLYLSVKCPCPYNVPPGSPKKMAPTRRCSIRSCFCKNIHDTTRIKDSRPNFPPTSGKLAQLPGKLGNFPGSWDEMCRKSGFSHDLGRFLASAWTIGTQEPVAVPLLSQNQEETCFPNEF